MTLFSRGLTVVLIWLLGAMPVLAQQGTPSVPTAGQAPQAAPTFNVQMLCATDAAGTTWTPCAVSADPCSGNVKTTTPFSIIADTVVITATASKKTYICHLVVVAAAADTFNITEGASGSTCVTSEAALVGSLTDSEGLSFAANGGVTMGNGEGTVVAGKTANVDVCIKNNAGSRLSGSVTWVQQ